MRRTVARAHLRSFAEAPCAKAGDVVAWVRADPRHPGWFLGRDTRGVEGYFATGWFDVDEARRCARAQRDYDAGELSVGVGESVEVVETYGGWLRVAKAGGAAGWIPEACID